VLAVLIALALHGGLCVGLRRAERGAPARAQPLDFDATVELALETEDVQQGREVPEQALPAPSADPVPATSIGRASRAAPQPLARVEQTAPAPAAAEVTLPEGAEAPADAIGAAPGVRPIDLGLNGGVRRAALLGDWFEPVAKPKPPSDGGLLAGLAALDAERGQSRSNAANHAAFEAASRYAPATGMGIFDILTDEHGVVLSVTLASAPADTARWQRVGQELQQLLKERRLRVPPGAKGLSARLRIETGALARENADRSRTKRGPALGQESLHPREIHYESTRASLEPGQLSPTLGVTLAGGGSGQRIRVVLLSERTL
jgi:hypothetical protein